MSDEIQPTACRSPVADSHGGPWQTEHEASCDFGFWFLAFNFQRCISDISDLEKAFRAAIYSMRGSGNAKQVWLIASNSAAPQQRCRDETTSRYSHLFLEGLVVFLARQRPDTFFEVIFCVKELLERRCRTMRARCDATCRHLSDWFSVSQKDWALILRSRDR